MIRYFLRPLQAPAVAAAWAAATLLLAYVVGTVGRMLPVETWAMLELQALRAVCAFFWVGWVAWAWSGWHAWRGKGPRRLIYAILQTVGATWVFGRLFQIVGGVLT